MSKKSQRLQRRLEQANEKIKRLQYIMTQMSLANILLGRAVEVSIDLPERQHKITLGIVIFDSDETERGFVKSLHGKAYYPVSQSVGISLPETTR